MPGMTRVVADGKAMGLQERLTASMCDLMASVMKPRALSGPRAWRQAYLTWPRNCPRPG